MAQDPPLSLRLPKDDEEWLRMHAEYTGQPVNALLRLAVADLRAKVTDAHLITFGTAYDPAHEFVPPGQVSPDRPAPDKCMQCGKPAGVHLATPGDARDPGEISRR